MYTYHSYTYTTRLSYIHMYVLSYTHTHTFTQFYCLLYMHICTVIHTHAHTNKFLLYMHIRVTEICIVQAIDFQLLNNPGTDF